MIGTKLAERYEIQAEIGRGGMGAVYRAHDLVLKRDVAVKLIPPLMLKPKTERRFQREAQVVARLDHPSIVPVFDYGRHEDALFLVMPVVAGKRLRDLMRAGGLSKEEILGIAIRVAEALDYSHHHGVIHRDIKPENIMVSYEKGGSARVRVMDFGLALAQKDHRITREDALMGTVAYISPEQVEGIPLDGRSDLYALGTVLYEALAGRLPFGGRFPHLLLQIVNEEPPAITDHPEIDENLNHILLKCLAKDPAERFQTCQELAATLREYMGGNKELSMAGAGGASFRFTPPPQARVVPFVARQKQRTEMAASLDQLIGGDFRFVMVAGSTGVGKSRLLEEWENLARNRGIRVLRGRYMERDSSFPFQGFCELIQDFYRGKETESKEDALPDVSDLANDLTALFPVLNEVASLRPKLEPTGLEGAQLSPTATDKVRIHDLLARTLVRLAGGRPIILFLEDLHGADVSLEALRYIVPRLGVTPTLIVGTYRTDEIDRGHPLRSLLAAFRGHNRFATLKLAPFTAEEHRLLVKALLPGGDPETELFSRLYEVTEGNALFTVEWVRSLQESGELVSDEQGLWSTADAFEISPLSFPASIKEAVEHRIERLPQEVRKVLSIAAIMGRDFEEGDLEALVGDHPDLDEILDRLIRDGLLVEARRTRGDRLTFSSGSLRDVVYMSISRRRRRTLHRRFARYLEKRHQDRLDRFYPELTHHFSLGDVPEKSVRYGLLSARKFLETFSPEEVIRSVKTILDFFDDEWEGSRVPEAEALTLLARAQRLRGNVEAALMAAEKAFQVYQSLDKPQAAAQLCAFTAETAWQGRQAEATHTWTTRGIEVARQAGDHALLHDLLALAATVANLRGEYGAATSFLEELARLERARDQRAEDSAGIPAGGLLRVGLTNPVHAADPVLLDTDEEAEVWGNVFETLLSTDTAGNLVPVLADSWTLLDDGRVLMLHLRPNIHFHDGHPLTAADVKRAFERAIRVAVSVPGPFAVIEGARAFARGEVSEVTGLIVKSKLKIACRLRELLPIYPMLLTDISCGITRVAAEGDVPVGTGPFRLQSLTKNKVVLACNPDHWSGRAPRADTLEFHVVKNAAACAQGLQEGRYDLVSDLLPDDLETFLREPSWRSGYVETPKKNLYFAVFQTNRTPCSQQPLRRALAGAFRPFEMVWQTLGRLAHPATGLLPPGISGHDPGRKDRALDEKLIRHLLKQLPYPPPLRLQAAVHPVMLDRYGALTRALFELWSRFGIEVEVATHAMEDYLKARQNPSGIDLLLGRWHADYEDPDAFTHRLFHSETGLLRRFYHSSETDRLGSAGRIQTQPGPRRKAYRLFEDYILEQAVLVPLFHGVDYRLANPRIRGLQLRMCPPFVNYHEIGRGEEPSASRSPNRGGVVRIPLAGVVSSLDPSLVSTVEQAEVVPNVFETLTRDLDGANIVPWLAESFAAENEGRRYRFRLRDQVHFHDGRRLTSRDVRYSLERMFLNPSSEGRRLFSPILGADDMIDGKATDLKGFRVLSSSEFTIDLAKPVAFFPALLTHMAAAIVPEKHRPGGRRDAQNIGTGAFKFKRFEPGKFLELDANTNYWRKGFPRCHRLLFHFDVPPEEIYAQFKAGRFALASDLFPQDVDKLFREASFAHAYREIPRLTTYFVSFNVRSGVLTNLELRQSLIQAFSRSASVKRTLGRLGIPARGLIPPGLLGHRPAAKLSMASSLSSGNTTAKSQILRLKIALHPIFFGEYAAFSRHFLRSVQKHGIVLEIVNERNPRQGWAEALEKAEVDLLLARWIADYPDADSFARGILHSKEGYLGRFCPSDEIDRLLEKGATEIDPHSRQALYEQIEDIINRQALLLPLFHEQVYRFAQPDLCHFEVTFSKPVVNYEKLSFDA